MKKYYIYLLSLLFVCLGSSQLEAQTYSNGKRQIPRITQKSLERHIQEKLAHPVDNSRVPTPTRTQSIQSKSQIAQALRKAIGNDLEEIGWADVAQQNEKLNKLLQENYNCVLNFAKTFSAKAAQSVHWSAKQPNYKQATKGTKYIYLADASDHGTKRILREVQTVLTQMRQANLQARILLALEFAYSMDPYEKLPLYFSTTSSKETLLEFAPEYAPLYTTAKNLKMDILGLDDMGWGEIDEEDIVGIKVGNKGVIFSLKGPQIRQIINTLNPVKSNKQENVLAVNNYLQATTWGIEQRNEQWARYIKAVAPFYDIVIVYTGEGHLTAMSSTKPLYKLIGQRYIQFSFYTTEQLPEEISNMYQERYNLSCDLGGACNYENKILSEEERLDIGKELYKPLLNWDGKSILYSTTTSEDDDRFEKSLTTQERNELNKLVENCPVLIDEDYSYSTFEVFLPAE